MDGLEELLMVLGLSMDGFAASVCLGIELGRRRAGRIALAIAGAHTALLLLGYALGAGARGFLAGAFPWAAAAILLLLSANLLRAAGAPEEPAGKAALSLPMLALATSVDAMVVGAALALLGARAWEAGALTAGVMGSLSLAGALLGGRVGGKYRRASRFLGGAILALLGLKTLWGAVSGLAL